MSASQRSDQPLLELLGSAFVSPQGWRDFKAAAGGSLGGWITRYDHKITDQVARRANLPAHHSTGALDEALAAVREFVEPRAFCYRNAERTTRMLDLGRLRLNRADDPVAYAGAIRAHLTSRGGKPGTQGAIRDPRGQYNLR